MDLFKVVGVLGLCVCSMQGPLIVGYELLVPKYRLTGGSRTS